MDNYKLTMVSIAVNGRVITKFAMLPLINGKPMLYADLFERFARELGVHERGMTMSIG